MSADGDDLGTGDALRALGPETLTLHSAREAEVILVDVPLDFEPVGVWAGQG